MPKTKASKTRAKRKAAENNDHHGRLQANLSYLGLTRIAETYRDHIAQALKDNHGHLAFLDAVIDDESAVRFDRRVKRRISRARFPVTKTIDAFDWNHPRRIDRQKVLDLFELDFLEKKRNALFIGGTGLGKSHLAVALGIAACREGHSVLFRTAMEIVNELTAAQSDETFLKALRSLTRPDLLIIDELGYLPIDKHGADLIFQVVSQRYERGSIVLTTNRAPKDWGKVFNDSTVASAVLDRLAHHSEIVVIDGKSYRTQREAA